MSCMSDTFLLMTSDPLDQRLHTMVSKKMKHQLDLARRAPGFKTEADVVRYAIEQILPSLLPDETPYAGRTRLLADTAAPPKRVGTERDPVRLRDAIPEAVASIPYAPSPVAPQTRDQELGYVVEGDPFAPPASA